MILGWQIPVRFSLLVLAMLAPQLLFASAASEVSAKLKPNHLIDSSSPYLLQHAYNPVDWYPWGEEAFVKARKENKPVFLSIGYSTCHWCHVMARESFENPEIADLLNRYFVAIKVDREERPDIDAVYMTATRLINGSGGWPMTVFLDQQLRPFHAATYYPPYTTEKGTGLKDILLKVHELWAEQPDLIRSNAEQVRARITAYANDSGEPGTLAESVFEQALTAISESYDEDFGGFSVAPKFPRPGIFAFLNTVQTALPVGKKKAEQMMRTTLDAMANGGIFDQIGGGFHRYSVDESWQVPHFEKMLYSQALMSLAYTDFYSLHPTDKYRQVVTATLEFVLQDMRSPQGGFYSALDADSERPERPGEHAEGAYYLWSNAELKKLLTPDELAFFRDYFHIREQGNIFSDPQGEFGKLNILYVDEGFRDRKLTGQQKNRLNAIRSRLAQARRKRPPPHMDDKIITAWNGMMISALAKAARVFARPDWLAHAGKSMAFAEQKLFQPKTGELLRHYRFDQHREQGGERSATVPAVLADYVWMINALLELYQASDDNRWLKTAIGLQQNQDTLFLDKSSGAYFNAADNDANLLFRFKSIFDDALPAANAIALSNLYRLARLDRDKARGKTWSRQAGRLLGSFANAANQYPLSAASLLAVELAHEKGRLTDGHNVVK